MNNEFNCFNLLPYFPTRLTETPYSRGRFQTSLSEIGGLSCLRDFFLMHKNNNYSSCFGKYGIFFSLLPLLKFFGFHGVKPSKKNSSRGSVFGLKGPMCNF